MVSLVKMTNKSFNPIGIGLFGTQAVMFEAYLATHLIQQSWCSPVVNNGVDIVIAVIEKYRV